ncbi:PREDICTED: tigger transposable element-derived protein 1-like [Eufriesea mexicana]|uniref:tigger transposable element-derived protein 1-like n=1 Tax=Eufriesea mexicana TaxID=516756 RepID=UPI00083C0D76|nr:PREDICTED: tigger transposable element-derived protein 1-like [Eufriesea mexicana]
MVVTQCGNLVTSAVYCPLKHNLKEENFQDFFSTIGPKFIVGGDFNSKNTLWGSRLTTAKGKELAKLLQEKKYAFLSSGTPTYWPTDPIKIIISERHGIVMDEMERSLSSWIDDQHQNNVPLSFSIIQAKAVSLHENWKTRLNEDSNTVFQASNGWFDKFKMRYSLHNIKFTGESADADKDAAKEFIFSLSKITEDGEHSPSQIFNVDETAFQKPIDITLLGGNLAGDLQLKPLLVYQAEDPRTLKRKDWFTHHFVPTVKQYCKNNNLQFKALLILDNVPRHPKSLHNLYPEINVVFLPPNTLPASYSPWTKQ